MIPFLKGRIQSFALFNIHPHFRLFFPALCRQFRSAFRVFEGYSELTPSVEGEIMLKRLIELPTDDSFFLFGARGSEKSMFPSPGLREKGSEGRMRVTKDAIKELN